MEEDPQEQGPAEPLLDPGRGRTAGAVLAALALLVYAGPMASGDLILDDRVFLVEDVRVQGVERGAIWTASLFSDAHGALPRDGLPQPRPYFRPLVLLSLAWSRDLVGLSPPALRLPNLVLHVVLALWIWARLRRSVEPPLALGGAALFVLHPLGPEVVAWISGRSDAMCLAGFLLALEAMEAGLTHRARIPLGAAALAFFAAAASKETALALAPLLPALGALRAGRAGLGAGLAVAGVGGGAYLVLRRLALGAWVTVGAEAVAEADPARGFAELSTWLAHLLVPVDLRHFFYPPEPLLALGPLGAWLMPFLLLALAGLAARRARAEAVLGVGLCLLPLVPLLALTQPAFPYGDRYLYMPVLGLALLLPLALVELMPARAGLLVLAVLGGAAGLSAFHRARVWCDEVGLWQAVVAQPYRPAKAWIWLAEALRSRGRLDEALAQVEAGLGENPSDPAMIFELGLVQKARGRFAEAAAAFERVGPERDPAYPGAQLNLVYLALRAGDRDRALGLVERLLGLYPELATAWAQRGAIWLAAGDAAGAEKDLAEALARFDRDPAVHLDRALALRALGRRDEAIRHLRRAVELAPREPRFLGALGALLEEAGQRDEARYWLGAAAAMKGAAGS